MAPKHIYKKLCNRIKNLLSKKTFGKVLYFISESEKNNNETKHYIDKMIDNNDIIPIISISNKDGTNINNLHKIIYNLPPRKKWEKDTINGSIVYIDSKFNVPGIGTVVSGTIKGNDIKVKDKMFIGPFNGIFHEVLIRSIHNSIRENVQSIGNDVQGCFAIKSTNSKISIDKNMIKKGMVLLNSLKNWKDNITKEFEAKITILQHSTTIRNGYSPIIHCGPIRQTAQIKVDKNVILRINDSYIAKFQFKFNSEFLEKNMIFFFRDGNTKGVGEILSLS
tara:strand:- start:154 stop:990 length:837 start_codon:yes stop_codon:yes gene_type:complete